MTTWTGSELRSLPAALRRSVAAAPDKIALHMGDTALTYAQLHSRATSAAAGLHKLGVRSGEAVAVLAHNSDHMVAALLACGFIEAVFTPINVSYKGEFLRHQLDTTGARVVVVDAVLAPAIAQVAVMLPKLEHVIVIGLPRQDGESIKISGVACHEMDALYDGSGRLPAEVREARGDAVGAVIFTAGTTGPSKGVAMSQNYLCVSADQVFKLRGGTTDTVVYAALPLFHLAALSLVLLGPVVNRATGALDDRFSPNTYWDRVRHFAADHTVLLGAMSTMLWNRPAEDEDADNPIDVAMIAPMSAELQERFERRFNLTVLQMYSQSEVYPLMISETANPAPPGSSGRPNPNFTVKLFDHNEAEVAPGQVGEVVVRPNRPHVMFTGYFGNPQGTVDVWRNGWMHTGDLGRFDEDGYFWFADRKKDYLRRRGENISSFEVEDAARKFNQVSDIAVVSTPSDLTEDDVVACVVPASDTGPFDHVAFFNFCASNMPYFAVPRYIWITPDLPRNPVGRVEKYKLRERLRSGDNAALEGLWDAEAHGCVARRGVPEA